ncbi:anti-sigma factor, partial [Bacillus anthracis]|nr:anti-sigma factor [Bacillus anthracis]
MKEFANQFVIFEVAGVTKFLAFIALLICVASWVYIDAKVHQMSKGWSVFKVILPFFFGFLLYMIRSSKKIDD